MILDFHIDRNLSITIVVVKKYINVEDVAGDKVQSHQTAKMNGFHLRDKTRDEHRIFVPIRQGSILDSQ